jgi:glycerol-3-phosphate acyltransferase PlsY
MIQVVLGIFVSYLIGSIPTAYLVGKWVRGIDIRQYGSGHVGATHVFRVVGKMGDGSFDF